MSKLDAYENTFMNQIKTGAMISYASLFLNIITGILYTPWMINSIGKADYGLYALAMSLISLFVFDFGLGNAITRFVSKYLAEGRQDKVDNLLGVVFKLYLLGDLIILCTLIVIYFFIPTIYQGLTSEEIQNFKVVYLIASAFSVISFPFLPLNGVITSYEKFIPLKSCGLIHRVIVVILMTACLLMGGGVFSLVIVNSIAGITIILLKIHVLGATRIKSINFRLWDKNIIREVFSFSAWVTVTMLAQRCIFSIAPSIMGALADSQSITMLSIAITLEGFTYTFASALNGMFLPRVSRMLANNNKDEILQLMIRVGRIQIYIIGLVCVGFLCCGRQFINVWVGEDFYPVYACALMIILPSFLQLPQEIGSSTLIAEGKVKLQAIAFMGMAIINIALAIPLTKFFGVYGICFSIMIAYLFRTFAMDYIFYKKLNLNILCFFKESFLKTGPSIIIATIASIGILCVLPLTGIVELIVDVIIVSTIYSISIYMFAMNNNEKSLVLLPLKKIFRLK